MSFCLFRRAASMLSLFLFSTHFVSILMKSCGLSDYVCVLDLGMFELSLLTCDGSEKVKKEHNFSPVPLCNILSVFCLHVYVL